MKKTIIFAGVVILLLTSWIFLREDNKLPQTTSETVSKQENVSADENQERTVISDGSYEVDTEKSIVNWSGKKPLIDGYINSGEIRLAKGEIDVSQSGVKGSFVIAMDTLKVGLTAKKPNQESALEGHLKSERWFDVEEYPIATFVINKLTPKSDSGKSITYTIEGDLTMKAETYPVSFDALVYESADKTIRAEATTEIDRTKWGITANSSSFFDNLADNAIDNMIALSFTLVARKK